MEANMAKPGCNPVAKQDNKLLSWYLIIITRPTHISRTSWCT